MATNVDGTFLSYATVADYTATPLGAIWTDVAGVQKVTPGKITVKDNETTTLLATDQWETFEPARKNVGNTTITAFYTKEDEALLIALVAVATVFKITLRDGSNATNGSTWICTGFLNELGEQTPEGDKVKTDLSIKFTGKPVFAPYVPA